MTAREPDRAGGAEPGPVPVLGVFQAVTIIVGLVIGAGIFRTPGLVADATGSAGVTLAVWVAGGLLSLVGALTYAELATTWPGAGGDYGFLTRAYGRDVGFFFAWARITVILSGSIALLAFVLGDHLSQIHSFGAHSSALYAAVAVVALTGLNLLGLRQSARAQAAMTVLQLAGVLLVILAGLALVPGADPPPPDGSTAGLPAAPPPAAAIGLSLVLVLLTFGGWNEAAYVSAEVKGPGRPLLRALVIALVIITLVYVTFVAAALRVLGLEGLRASQAPGMDVMRLVSGPAGAQAMGLLVALSTLTSINATMLVGARTHYVLGRDWPVFAFMGRWDGRRHAPLTAFLVQAAIALGLIGFGAFRRDGFLAMVEVTAPVFWFFFMLAGIALFVLRWKEPATARPFRVPGYPVLPLVFVMTCAGLLWSSTVHAQSQGAGYIAPGVMTVGGLVWGLIRWRGRGSRSP